jgi:hypothetical protein
MSKTLILNPNDQPTGKWRLINELRASLSDPDFDTLRIAVAFAKTGPLYRLQPEIEAWRKQKKVIEGIFGIDHCGTSRQALEFALAKFSKVRLLHFDGRFTFHPKMYLFSGPKRCRFYIGSHNLTVGGTETNWESGTRMDLILPEDNDARLEAGTAWDALLSMSVELTKSLLNHFDGLGKLLNETKLPRRKSGEAKASEADTTLLPAGATWPKLVIKPPSPLPKSLFAPKAKSVATPSIRPAKPRKSKTPPAEALVIQIVPHHNAEVLLSKIALNQNPDFFGWPFTGRTTPKKAGNLSYPQRTPDPIINLTVYGACATPLVHMPRFALNTVFYEKKSEIRITVGPEVLKNTPESSILVMRQAPPDSDYDYDFEIYTPDHPQFVSYLEVCNQTLPTGGKKSARRMGWL